MRGSISSISPPKDRPGIDEKVELTRPVGPAPNSSTEEPIFGAILSKPWAAQEAGSSSVASTSDRFLILNTRPAATPVSQKRPVPGPRRTPTRIGTELGKPAVHGYTVSLEVFAEQLLPTPAVEALSAQLGVISHDALADLEAFDLGADGGDDADGFVAWSIDQLI